MKKNRFRFFWWFFRGVNLCLWSFGAYTLIAKYVIGLPAVQRWGLTLMWKGFWSNWF